LHAGAPELLEAGVEAVLAEADLDGDFPIADRADANLVGIIFDRFPCRYAELRIIEYELQEGVRIQQQLQGT
jgi:hypothetical protein